MNGTNKAIKISLSLALMIFVLTMTPATTFFQSAQAATLTTITILPANNIVNTRTTYDIMFKTATTATIKTIEMTFPSAFDLSPATRYIEKVGIGSGSLSNPSSNTLIYTVNNPESISAGTNIRLEIGKIVNSNTAGSFTVGITTKNTAGSVIDGSTQSSSFPIKDITGDDIADNSVTSGDIQDNTISGSDVSPGFMIRKTLNDGDANWNPQGLSRHFSIPDDDITGDENSLLVSIMVEDPVGGTDPRVCSVRGINTVTGFWHFNCDHAPADGSKLDYIITKLPPNVATLSVSASSSSIPQDAGSINRQDETSSQFPSSLFASSQDIGSTNIQDESSSEFP